MDEQNSDSSIWTELRRRKVVRVTVVYVIAAAAVLQVLDIVVPALRLPAWTMTLLVVVALAALPLVAVLAWAYEITPEGVRRTSNGTFSAVGENGTRKYLPLVVLALLLIGTAAAWGLWLRPAARPHLSSDVVAVLPFAVRGPPEVQYLEEGMVDLLSTKLDGVAGLRAADSRALLALLERSGAGLNAAERASLVVERLGVGSYVQGSLVWVGRDRIQIEAALFNAKGEVLVRPDPFVGPLDELTSLVDRLSARLLGARTEGLTRLAALTTPSVPALKAYLEGEQAIRHGRFEAALEDFEQAISHDSTFALAYYRYSIAAEWAGRGDVLWALEQVESHVDRLTPHARDLLRAHLAWRNGRSEEAERRYRRIVDAHPDDVETWFQLGEVLFHSGPLRGRPLADAQEPWNKVLEFEPDNLFAHVHLARIASASYQPEKVAEHAQAARAAVPERDDRRLLEVLALDAISRGDTALERQVLAALREEPDPSIRNGAWYTSAFSRDLDASRRFAQLLLGQPRQDYLRGLGYLLMAHLEMAGGRIEAAMANLDTLQRIDPQQALSYRGLFHGLGFVPMQRTRLDRERQLLDRWRPTDEPSFWQSDASPVHEGEYPALKTYLLGLLETRLGETAAAERRVRELERLADEKPGSLSGDLFLGLRAQLNREAGELNEALNRLQEMQVDTVLYPLALHSAFDARAPQRFLRAEILNDLGRTDEAYTAYEAIVDQSPLHLLYLAPSHLRRGEIHERRGEHQRAAEQYARFLALWANSDTELRPLVDDVRRRLTRLTAEPAG